MSVLPDPVAAKATEAFHEALEAAWRSHRAQEEEIARAYAPISAQVTLLLEGIARSVSQVTGQEAQVREEKATFNVGRHSLLTHHTICHPGGDFRIHVLYARECIEYRNERLDHTDAQALLARIVRDALAHFEPKRIQSPA